MDANPIIPDRPDRHHVNVAFEFLAESIGEPIVHSHGPVAALNIACRNVFQIRVAFDAMLLGSDALSRAIFALGAIRGSAVNLMKDGIVHIAAECTLYGLQIGFVAICGELDRFERRERRSSIKAIA